MSTEHFEQIDHSPSGPFPWFLVVLIAIEKQQAKCQVTIIEQVA
jgi:hypothetical protein